MTDSEVVRWWTEGHVGVVEINRPDKFNCLSTPVLDGIQAALDSFTRDAGARALLVRGSGRHFCTGADLAEVLERLGASGREFDAVPDLCEMSARKDPALAEWAAEPGLRIVACYPRAVRWLFHAAGHALPEDATVLNMRTDEPEAILGRLESAQTVSEEKP